MVSQRKKHIASGRAFLNRMTESIGILPPRLAPSLFKLRSAEGDREHSFAGLRISISASIAAVVKASKRAADRTAHSPFFPYRIIETTEKLPRKTCFKIEGPFRAPGAVLQLTFFLSHIISPHKMPCARNNCLVFFLLFPFKDSHKVFRAVQSIFNSEFSALHRTAMIVIGYKLE